MGTTPDSPAAGSPPGHYELRFQCLRVLRCTARALASSPGGLRFKAGTRPWLEGLEPAAPPLNRFVAC
jgi:hypothetical protein